MAPCLRPSLVRPPILRPDPGLAASPPVRYRYLLAFTFVVRRELTTSHVKRRCATAPRPRPGRPDRGRAVLPDRPDPRPKRRLPRPAPTPGQRRWSGIQPAHDGKRTQLRGARWGRRSVDRLHRCALQQAPPHGRRAAAGGFPMLSRSSVQAWPAVGGDSYRRVNGRPIGSGTVRESHTKPVELSSSSTAK